jgi:transcription initiation factor TFIIA large subunit
MSLSGTPQFLPPAYPGGPSYQKSGGLAPAALPFAPTSLPQSTAYPAIPAPPPTVPDVKKEEKVHRNLDDEELNSGDELSDGDGEQEIDNYCVCMFDKMSRTKTKRKATLIHGVAHINGRDYIFSKANSEFDW